MLLWRFGASLGVDVLTGQKTCVFDCIYCQLGRTVNKVLKPEQLREYLSPKDAIEDLKACLRKLDLKSVDVITFSDCGEPTLNPD